MSLKMLHSIALAAAAGALALTAWADLGPMPDWTIAGPFGGTATTIALDRQHSNVLLAGGHHSLLYRSEDAGADWHLLHFPEVDLSQIASLLFDPADSNHYLAGVWAISGGGLFQSSDAGTTWKADPALADVGVRALTAAPSQPSRFVAGTMSGVWLSDDSGKSWARISDPSNLEMSGITAVAIDPKNPDTIYAGTPHLPWKTTDAGKTWQPIHNGMIDDSDVFSIFVDPNNPSSVLASACSGIYSSTNGGDLWRKLAGIPNTSRRTHVVREDVANPNIIFAGTTTGLFLSLNHGSTWKSVTDTQVNAMAADPADPSRFYLALEFAGLGKTIDGGKQIVLANQGFVDREITSLAHSGNKLFAVESSVGDGSGLFSSTDNGATWWQTQDSQGLSGVHLRTIAGLESSPGVLVAASSHNLYKSVNGGQLWKPLPIRILTLEQPKARPAVTSKRRSTRSSHPAPPPKPVEKVHQVTAFEIDAISTVKLNGQETLFAATDLGLLRSKDAGERWTIEEIPPSTGVRAIYSSPQPNGLLLVRTAAGLFASTDCGEHWSELNFPLPASEINDIALGANQDAPLLAATQRGLYMSRDGGRTWTFKMKGLPSSTVNTVAFSGKTGEAYAVEYGQLFQSTDGAQNWNKIPTQLSNLRIKRLWLPDLTSGRLLAVTSGLGILYRN
jgi:photosystem II stability/assembly factor-like uncharacterized protein